MDTYKNLDRRRNLLDIVADLAKAQPAMNEYSEPKPLPVPAASTPVAAMAALPAPVSGEALSELTEAQRRAAEQRMAAERALREALELEKRLAEEAEQVRLAAIAAQQARARELREAIEIIAVAERAAVEEAEACAKSAARLTSEKEQAAALKADDETAAQAASADVAAAEAKLAEARRKLEVAQAACTESGRRYADMCAAEEAARAKGNAAEQAAAAKRTEREALENELRAVEGQNGRGAEVASIADAAERRAAERRAADAAKRIAERRAADALRQSTAS